MRSPPRIVSLLVLNLMPALSAALFGWSAFALILLYWLENLILGFLNLPKIAIAGCASGLRISTIAFLLLPLFILQYGLFWMLHGLLIWTLFVAPGGPEIGFLSLIPATLDALRADRVLRWNAGLLAGFHAGYFLIDWLGAGRGRHADPYRQVFAPYGRIVIVHVAILLAGAGVVLLGQPLIAVVCLALLKTGLETTAAATGEASAVRSLGLLLRERAKGWEENSRT